MRVTTPVRFSIEYSVGGLFIPVDDQLGNEIRRDPRAVRRLETGQTIEAYWQGARIMLRMQKLQTSAFRA